MAAAAIAITSFAARPAMADGDDLAKALVAALGIAAIGTVIKKHNDRKDEKERAARKRSEEQARRARLDQDRLWAERQAKLRRDKERADRQAQAERERQWREAEDRRRAEARSRDSGNGDHVGRGSNDPLYGGNSHISPRPVPRDVARKLLPGQCLQSGDTSEGRQQVFAFDCLSRNFPFTGDLPAQCRTTVDGQGRGTLAYEATCLRDRGYQLARR
ncbi:hypothetical protein AB1M95_01260 [Sulfitobacter sp. LCG007]